MPLSVDDFIALLDEISIVTRENVQAVLDSIPAGALSTEELGQALVANKLLTAYQVQQILIGKGKELCLGNYLVLDKLGQGGMGIVLKAEHRRMKRLVALKILAPAMTPTPAAVRRFQREVEAAAKLIHPNIVAAFDADESNGVHYLVMEYVPGWDLNHQLALEGPFPIEKGLNYILQAAHGLAFAHEKGIVHRDIKPANLLLDHKGSVKILDLGLASMHGQGFTSHEELTQSGEVFGTVDYMSPEQACNTHQVDARTDIYSLGCTLYRLLSGRNMYESQSLVQKLMAHQTEPIPALRSPHGEIPAELASIYLKMVAKNVEDRYATMPEVIDDLQQVIATYFPAAVSKINETTSIGNRPNTSQRSTNDGLTVAVEVKQSSPALLELVEPAPTVVFALQEHGTDSAAMQSTMVEHAKVNLDHKSQASARRKTWLIVASVAGSLLGGYVAYNYFIAPPAVVESVNLEQPSTRTTDSVQAVSGPELLLSPDYVWGEPINLGPGVNTENRELRAALTNDECTLIFTRGLELWMSERTSIDQEFQTAVRLPEAVNASHRGEIHSSISGDGLTLAFTSNRDENTSDDVWIAQRSSRNHPFGMPERLDAPVNSLRTERGVTISADGLLLLVTSDRNSSRGHSEIYQFTRATLGEPFKKMLLLSPQINAPAWNVPSWISQDKRYLLKTRLKKTDSFMQLFVRATVDAPFVEGVSLSSPFDRLQSSMPVFSIDGKRAYFHTRDLPGAQDLDLWMVHRVHK